VKSAANVSRAEIVELHRRHVWPPYTSADEHASIDPLVIVHAEGSYLEDKNGKRYIDGNGSWWTNVLGHGHPRLIRALREQSETLLHCASSMIANPQAALLAAEIVAVAPKGISRAHFSDDGSTAVEVAIKTAFQYWQQNGRERRVRFIALSGAFHGDTLGAVSLGGVAAFRNVFAPLVFDVLHAPVDDVDGFEKAVHAIEKILETKSDEIAAVIVEPLIQGAAGMRMWPAALLRRIREATSKADTFLIADEVFTGYGRTGTMWACDQAQVSPDLLCTAKSFSGGVLPMAATLSTERVYEGFKGDRSRALMHGHTFSGNALGASVAREVLAIYEDEKILDQIALKHKRIAQAFAKLQDLPGVVRTRSLGMVGACDVGSGGYAGKSGWRVYEHGLSMGAFLRPLGDTVYITPRFNIEDSVLDRLLEIVAESIRLSVR
jgi:adenosylmethionine-8-amino-7-oxononanoate aminotransferase